MKEKKNIDRIFQEKFKEFEREPGEQVWTNIASRLDAREEKRTPLFPLWLKVGGVAAVLAIILASLLFIKQHTSGDPEQEIVFEKPEKPEEAREKQQESSEKSYTEITEEATLTPGNEISNISDSKSEKTNSALNTKASSRVIAGKPKNTSVNRIKGKTAINASEATPEPAIAIQQPENPGVEEKSIQDRLAEAGTTAGNDPEKSTVEQMNENALAEIEKEKNNETEEVVAETDAKKLRLSTFAAPVFYKNIGDGNELSNQFSNNSTSSEVTFSYGLKIAYQISNKLKIRTGISKIDINKNIKDISYTPSAMAVGFENISSGEDNIAIRDNSPNPPTSGLPMFNGDGGSSLSNGLVTPGELNQQFGYIEVPVELEYNLIDSKIALAIIGGGSSLFLDNNRVQLVSGELKTDLGKATNINSTSFSTNIGLGVDYALTNRFSLSLEPIFKYQINTFSKVENVQPVNFGIYSGLSFKF